MRHENETIQEYINRATEWLNSEYSSILDDLPNLQSFFEYFDLWSIYDTDFLSGIEDSISEGDDPKPLHDFIDKYNLPWKKITKNDF